MSELNSMSCAEFHDSAAELALGVLTGRERAEALAHLFAGLPNEPDVTDALARAIERRNEVPEAIERRGSTHARSPT